MGVLLATDIMLLVLSIYVGLFFKFFHSSYPEMKVGFHIWEVCYSKDTWRYGNRLAGNIAMGLGIVLFGIIYPILIYLGLKRSYMSVLIVLFVIIFFGLLFGLTKVMMRKKFDLKDN